MVWAVAAECPAQNVTTRVVTGSVSVPGERDAYIFSLTTPTRFYFDSLANQPNLQWSLNGPPGSIVTNRSFSASDAQTVADPTLGLPPGDYTLTIYGPSAATGDYAFRFVDVSEATLIAPGADVGDTLSPANRSELYRFSATAGDRYIFLASRASLPHAWCHSIDPYGNQVFSQSLDNVGTLASAVVLRTTGDYTLLVEGYIGETGSGSYVVRIVPEGNVPPPAFTGAPIQLGGVVSGNFTANTPT